MNLVGHTWHPLEAPEHPEGLQLPEIRGFTRLWHKQRSHLVDSGLLEPFLERMNRWWSIETGVIERIYTVSAGATVAMVERGFTASLIPHGETDMDPHQLVRILNDHREALNMVMDVVGGTRPLTVGWIKELHALLTRHQEWSEALDPRGALIHVPLIRGEFKVRPNNPLRSDGLIHQYCPPEQVSSEMERLVSLYHQLPDSLPEVRAAWLHHAFTQIHPFQDGNGRVARALASVDFIRSGLFPLVVDRSDRDRYYIPALENADSGDLRPLISFFGRCLERVLVRAISEAEDTLGARKGLGSVLSAARAKVEQRKHQERFEREVMSRRMEQWANLAYDRLKTLGDQTDQEVPGVRSRVDRPTSEEQRRWFNQQILELGQRFSYWVDVNAPRTWVRLQLRDGGVTDLVVAFHFIGSPSPGSCMAAILLDHRDRQDRRVYSTERSPIHLNVEPLLLISDDDEHIQSVRLHRWLDEATVEALAAWARFL